MKILSGLLLVCLSLHGHRAGAVFPLCTKQTLAGKIQNVLTPVRHYGPVDRRGTLTQKAREFKLTKAEIAQIKKSFGFMFCQSAPGKKPIVGGAFLAGNNCEIWTAGHLLQDEDGSPIDLTKCGFQNFEIPGQRTSIDKTSTRNIVPWVPQGSDGRLDRARLRLKTCVPGATPFLVEDVRMSKGTEYMSLMAANSDVPSGNEPILSPGKVEDDETLEDGSRLLYTSSDGDQGGSGGVDIVRSKGRLAVRAIQIQMKSPISEWREGMPKDGEPYNRLTNHNRDLELSGPVLKALQAP